MSLLKEFREFAIRGNVINLAVGLLLVRSLARSFHLWLRISSCHHWAY